MTRLVLEKTPLRYLIIILTPMFQDIMLLWFGLSSERDESLLQKMRNSISTKKVDRTDYCIEDADELEDDSYRHNSCQLM